MEATARPSARQVVLRALLGAGWIALPDYLPDRRARTALRAVLLVVVLGPGLVGLVSTARAVVGSLRGGDEAVDPDDPEDPDDPDDPDELVTEVSELPPELQELLSHRVVPGPMTFVAPVARGIGGAVVTKVVLARAVHEVRARGVRRPWTVVGIGWVVGLTGRDLALRRWSRR